MNPNLKSVGRYGRYAALLGAIFSIAALIVVVSQSGSERPSLVCTILVYVGYWPMLLMGRTLQELFVSFWLIPMNVICWGIVGCLLGLLRSMVE
jgi:hypothetical protein